MKKNTKIAVIACAVIALAAGGFGVWKYTQNLGKTEQTVPNEVQDMSSQLGLRLSGVSDEAALRGSNVYLDDPFASITHGWFSPSETGYYYKDYRQHHTLAYWDTEARIGVPLCAQPQCLHDGSLYCTATTEAYQTSSPLYCDGWVYAVGYRSTNPEDILHTSRYGVVLRYAPGGTEITELLNFGDATIVTEPIQHQGSIWYVIQRTIERDAEAYDWHTDSYGRVQNTGFAICGYEIASGKAVTLAQFIPDSPEKHMTWNAPNQRWGMGTDLYFPNPDSNSTRVTGLDGPGTYKISLLTGEISKVHSQPALLVCDGQLLWNDGKTWNHVELDTGAETPLLDANGKALLYPVMDADCIYGIEQRGSTNTFAVYSRQGERLQSIPLPADEWIDGVYLGGGKAYVEINGTLSENGYGSITAADSAHHRLIAAPTDALRSGTAEWQLAMYYELTN